MHSEWSNFQCPLRKGIIYYSRYHLIFEHDIYSSSKDEVHLRIQSAEALRLNSYPSHGWLQRLNLLQWETTLWSFQSIAIEFYSLDSAWKRAITMTQPGTFYTYRSTRSTLTASWILTSFKTQGIYCTWYTRISNGRNRKRCSIPPQATMFISRLQVPLINFKCFSGWTINIFPLGSKNNTTT